MLSIFKRKSEFAGLVGLSIGDERVSLAQISRSRSQPFLRKCASINIDSSQQIKEILGQLVAEMGLDGAPCNCVLAPRDYNIYLVEAPIVEPEELRSAVRWKIKDLLDMPVEDAAIDVFPVPDDAFQGRSKMLYVVASQRSRVENTIELVTRSGLQLVSIDIPEMAMRNMSVAFMNDDNGLAFMDLRKTGSIMNLTRQGQLYLTRKINTPLDDDVMVTADWDSTRDRLVLEIQRSLDYYESQMGQNPVSKLIIAPRANDAVALAAALDEAMTVNVTAADITQQLEHDKNIDAHMLQTCFAAIGAAMRAEQAAVTI